MYVFVYVCMYVCMYMSMYVCIKMCRYLCKYVGLRAKMETSSPHRSSIFRCHNFFYGKPLIIRGSIFSNPSLGTINSFLANFWGL